MDYWLRYVFRLSSPSFKTSLRSHWKHIIYRYELTWCWLSSSCLDSVILVKFSELLIKLLFINFSIYVTRDVISSDSFRGATTFSKLGFQFLGLGYYYPSTEKIRQVYPVWCSWLHNHTLFITVTGSKVGGPSKFWGVRTSWPLVVAPMESSCSTLSVCFSFIFTWIMLLEINLVITMMT